MSYYWHGYVTFDLTALAAGDRTSVIAALKDDLDGSPTDPQPARRWHIVNNGGVYIVEATFDLAKLNTDNLNTVAQSAVPLADLTDKWEPFCPFQEWERSRVKAHSFIDDRGWDIDGYDQFIPASNNIADVQAAIDAAIANGSGEVECTGLTVTLKETGSIVGALLGRVYYGLLVDGDNVGIKGGTFVLDAGESYSSPYVAILFTSLNGTPGRPGDTGPWQYNNWLKGTTIDGSALSDAERLAMCQIHTAHVAVFDYCQDYYMRDVTSINGWAGNAQLGTQASSRYGYFLECDVQSGVSYTGSKWAYWFDGSRYCALIACKASMPNAFKFQSNLDNTELSKNMTVGVSSNNLAVGCHFTELNNPTGTVAFGCTGSKQTTITDCIFEIPVGGGSFWSRHENMWKHYEGCVDSNDCVVENCVIDCGVSQRPFELGGITENPIIPGTPLKIEGFIFRNNIIVGATRRGYFSNALVEGAIISGNTYPAGATAYQYTYPADQPIIEANNELQ